MQLSYIEVPLLAKFTIASQSPVQGFFYLGPYGAVKVEHEFTGRRLDGREVILPDGNEIEEELSPADAGGVIGAGLNIDAGTLDFVLDMRFTASAVSIYTDGNDFIGNNMLAFSLGLAF